jgi:trk system potassium uptake protein TrkA
VTRAFDPLHARVLLAVGAHEVVNPEYEMGGRLARHLAQPNVIDQIVLTPDDTMAEVHTPQAIVGMKVGTAELVSRYNVEILAVVRGGRVLSRDLVDLKLSEDDRLVVLGPPGAVHRFAALA